MSNPKATADRVAAQRAAGMGGGVGVNAQGRAESDARLRASFEGRLCPLLSAKTISPPPKIVGAPPAEGEAIGCQGPNCMLFVVLKAPDGTISGGGCAIGMIPAALNLVQMSIAAYQTAPSPPPSS